MMFSLLDKHKTREGFYMNFLLHGFMSIAFIGFLNPVFANPEALQQKIDKVLILQKKYRISTRF